MMLLLKILTFLPLVFFGHPDSNKIIIDSEITFEEAMSGKKIPSAIKEQLTLIDVYYYSSDNKKHKGQLLIDKTLKNELLKIFEIIEKGKFIINKVIPVSRYNWSDSLSMADNNTSAFNYRPVKGTRKLSAHSYGRAIDINPLLNPQFKRSSRFPHNGNYNKDVPGTLHHESAIVKAFKKHGWKWGGNWKSTKDYMHFEK